MTTTAVTKLCWSKVSAQTPTITPSAAKTSAVNTSEAAATSGRSMPPTNRVAAAVMARAAASARTSAPAM